MKFPNASSGFLVPILLLLLAVGLMVGAAVGPFVHLQSLEEETSASQAALARLRSQIASEAELRKENSDLAVLGQDMSLLLDGEKIGIAGANLQKLLSSLVAAHGGTASSVQVLPPKEDGNLTRIPMSLTISVGIDGLRDILHSLETSTPLIFIDDIIIRSTQDEFAAPDPNFLGPLEVTLQVSGFALQNGAS